MGTVPRQYQDRIGTVPRQYRDIAKDTTWTVQGQPRDNAGILKEHYQVTARDTVGVGILNQASFDHVKVGQTPVLALHNL